VAEEALWWYGARNSPSLSPDTDVGCRGEDAAGVNGAVSLVDII
jgi:hypothetical protein